MIIPSNNSSDISIYKLRLTTFSLFMYRDKLFPTTYILEEYLKNCIQKRLNIASLRLLSLEGPTGKFGPWLASGILGFGMIYPFSNE